MRTTAVFCSLAAAFMTTAISVRADAATDTSTPLAASAMLVEIEKALSVEQGKITEALILAERAGKAAIAEEETILTSRNEKAAIQETVQARIKELEETTLRLSETNTQLLGYKQLVGDQALLLESLRTKIATFMILQRALVSSADLASISQDQMQELYEDGQFQTHLKEQGASLYKDNPAIQALIDDPACFQLTTTLMADSSDFQLIADSTSNLAKEMNRKLLTHRPHYFVAFASDPFFFGVLFIPLLTCAFYVASKKIAWKLRNIPLLGSLYLFDLCALSALYVLVFKKDPFRSLYETQYWLYVGGQSWVVLTFLVLLLSQGRDLCSFKSRRPRFAQIVKFTTTLVIAAFHSAVSFVPALIGRTPITLSSSMLVIAYCALAVIFVNMYFVGKAVTPGSVDTTPGDKLQQRIPSSEESAKHVGTKLVPRFWGILGTEDVKRM